MGHSVARFIPFLAPLILLTRSAVLYFVLLHSLHLLHSLTQFTSSLTLFAHSLVVDIHEYVFRL